MRAGSGFSVPRVIFPWVPDILVLLAYCVHRMCSLRKFFGGWRSLGTYLMRQADLLYSSSSIKTKFNPQPSLLLGYVGLEIIWLGYVMTTHQWVLAQLKSAYALLHCIGMN